MWKSKEVFRHAKLYYLTITDVFFFENIKHTLIVQYTNICIVQIHIKNRVVLLLIIEICYIIIITVKCHFLKT